MINEFNIKGNLWIDKNDKAFIGKGRVQLLKNIQIYGSISKAAKHMKMSYKAAWDSVDIMNKLSQKPLVTKVTGGKGGGGTVITTYAKEIINHYEELEYLHKKYLSTLDNYFEEIAINGKNEEPVFSKLEASITKIVSEKKNYEVELQLKSNQKLITIINEDFLLKKELTLNKKIQLLIETNSIVITKEAPLSSARNTLKGKILNINDDGINTYLSINCTNKDILNAKITNSSYKRLNLKKDDSVYASFKAYNINII